MIIWSDEQLAHFRQDPDISEESIYADQIMRPMAMELCPKALERFDTIWNLGDDPLGPNWHGFADELECAIKAAHTQNDEVKLHNYYSFLNWTLFEKTSYLHRETVVSPFEGLIEINPKNWMKYMPTHTLEAIVAFMTMGMNEYVVNDMRSELKRLKEDPVSHNRYWVPCHKTFTKIAIKNSIPYRNNL